MLVSRSATREYFIFLFYFSPRPEPALDRELLEGSVPRFVLH